MVFTKQKIYSFLCLLSAIFTGFSSVVAVLEPNRNVGKNEAPFMVYLEGGHFCGATLISDRIILTSAHCDCPKEKCLISLGSNYIDDFDYKDPNRLVLESVKFLPHEDYRLSKERVQSFNDIALYLLNTSLDLSKEHLRPIAGFAEVDYSKKALVYGWGSVELDGKSRAYHLKAREISLMSHDECKELMTHAIVKNVKQDFEFCSERAVCRGDSGGPIVQMHDGVPKLIGISTWVTDDIYNCSSAPHVYTNVMYFSDWIRRGIATLVPDQDTNILGE